MNYEQIETFLAIITYGSISQASKNLYVSQSTISTRIKDLESELGVQLIIREKGHRKIELTTYGNAFISVASKWASLWKETNNIKSINNIKTLTIASIDAINNYTFVSFFSSIINDFPDIRLNIRTHHSNEIYSLISSRVADIGFVFSRISYPDIICTPIFRELMYLVCDKKSKYYNNIDCSELSPENEIFLDWGLDYKTWHDSHFAPSLFPFLTVNTGSMLQRYIKDDIWGIAPMSVIRGAMKSNSNLTYYKLKTPPPPRICYLIKNRFIDISIGNSIEKIESRLVTYVSNDETICSFESWMLDEKH